MMMKRLIVLVVAIVFITGVVGLAFAADVTGTVTKIDGKKITVKDAKGKETTVEVKDTAGAKVDDPVEIKGGVVKVTKKTGGYGAPPAAGGYGAPPAAGGYGK